MKRTAICLVSLMLAMSPQNAGATAAMMAQQQREAELVAAAVANCRAPDFSKRIFMFSIPFTYVEGWVQELVTQHGSAARPDYYPVGQDVLARLPEKAKVFCVQFFPNSVRVLYQFEP